MQRETHNPLQLPLSRTQHIERRATLEASERKLWQQTIWIGMVTGLIAVSTLIIDISLGMNQAYFETATTGHAGALIHPITHLDYALYSLAGILVFIPRLLLTMLLLVLLRGCFVPSEWYISLALVQMAMIGGIVSIFIILMGDIMSLYYTLTPDRYLFVLLIKVGNTLFAFSLQMGLTVILYALFKTKHLPREVVSLSAAILLAGFIYTLFATHPAMTSFFGIFIAYSAALVLVVYMLLVLRADNAKTTTIRRPPPM